MEMSVVRAYTFEAAHQLPWHDGKCGQMHGHSYRLEVHVSGTPDARGFIMDFAEIDEIVNTSIMTGSNRLDHSLLNIQLTNPTAELLILHIGKRLENDGLQWSKLVLWETERGRVVVER